MPTQPVIEATGPLPELGARLHRSLALRQLRRTRVWLNRISIEMLHRDSPDVQRHREQLIPRLLDGPAQRELWAGLRLPSFMR